MSIRKGIFAAALAVAAVAGAANASIVHFSNGTQIWTSINSGASFVNSGNVTSVSNVSNLNGFGVVGLGFRASTGTFYATGSNGWLYTVSGLGTASVTLSQVRDLQSSTISFDFFNVGGQEVLRAVRGNDLIQVNMTTNALSVVNADTGHSFPSTANVNGTYYGITNDGPGANFYRINDAGAATLIGQSFVNDLVMAGGASLNGVYYTTGHVGGNTLFGTVNTSNGQFTQISSTALNAAGQMGMVVVIPLPPAAMAGMASLAGLGGLAWFRRRNLRRA